MGAARGGGGLSAAALDLSICRSVYCSHQNVTASQRGVTSCRHVARSACVTCHSLPLYSMYCILYN